MTQPPIPLPLFDTLEKIDATPLPVFNYLDSLKIPAARHEFNLCKTYLKQYSSSKDTFTSYRREIERLIHWGWLICKKSLIEMEDNDIRNYLQFIDNPPKSWMTTKIVNRFFDTPQGLRLPNPLWRPFVVKVPKVDHRLGKAPNKADYQLSSKSIEAIFAILSSLFSFLQQGEYVTLNPISLLHQKKGFIQRQQTRQHTHPVIRKLSSVQWLSVIATSQEMAREDHRHERTCFLMSAFYLLGLRISELAYTSSRMTMMSNFAPDQWGRWWYTTIGKGNQVRHRPVPYELLLMLKRYRTSLNLTPLPHREENMPLFPKLKGKKGLGSRQIRNLVQLVFDRAIERLKNEDKMEEAQALAAATVHWLRHPTLVSNKAG